jgi:hypothetical protein
MDRNMAAANIGDESDVTPALITFLEGPAHEFLNSGER